ncbi:UNVERIFIED_ORG: phytoene dehydrogenase-like protein [Xanthobacter viscosus]|uniref:Pyridine nucleotide-disulfide oxidoreductase domain-containing protein 2 n=1 Tax=Xanthobacter autotrophicus TaxID=280 RepID=A0A6C1KB49_XANAU|nr:NAD(P)/FAD-dependent oxidoreductase [Xanthobacter autotrophicus]TLX41380.1 NAD(P)/FAD-dependent oxidoreductase [Xanthobacter autotrophicus]
MAEETHDVVVVGAGHNNLTAAAYLSKAGLGVRIFERNAWFGGGVVTRETTAPGFKHDHHSTTHIFIQANPLIKNDELELKSKFGLEYIPQEIPHACLFPDGSMIQTFGSLDKTCESIAQHSQKDADSYRRFVEKARQIMPMLLQGLFNPPLPFGSFMALLDQSPEGRDLIGDLFRSSYDLVIENFEHEKVRMHFLKWASECLMAPEEQGTGIVLFLMCGMCHDYPAALPRGGSGELTAALIRCIQHHGGTVEANSEVRRLIVEHGQATGVEMADGRRINARKLVLASVHPHLLDEFLGGGLPDRLKALAKGVKLSSYSAMNTHYALKHPPQFIGGNKVAGSYIVEGMPASLDDFRRSFDDYRYGRLPHVSTLCIGVSTNLDQSRAPDGMATLYLYNFMPYDLADGGAERWDEIKDEVANWMLEELRKYTTNMGDDNIIARAIDSPLDMERSSKSFVGGDFHGGALNMNQFSGRRPFPEISNYTVPGFERFYLTGPFMHPGGGVFGGGRATAVKIFQDLGLDLQAVLSR